MNDEIDRLNGLVAFSIACAAMNGVDTGTANAYVFSIACAAMNPMAIQGTVIFPFSIACAAMNARAACSADV